MMRGIAPLDSPAGIMVTDGVIVLEALNESELNAILAMSQPGEAGKYIHHWSLERHRDELANPDVFYLRIAEWVSGPMLGYVILALDPDGAGVECRRIVVGNEGQGTGTRAMNLLDRYCREVLGRTRIWLDVYDHNARGRHVYESCGYRRFKESDQDGRTLLFYEKDLSGG